MTQSDWKRDFKKKYTMFRESSAGDIVCWPEQNGQPAEFLMAEDMIEFIEKLLAQKEEEVRTEWVSKLNMIRLGILAFQEFEKQRPIDEAKGIRCKDGGPTIAAFSFISQLKAELYSLTTKEEI